MTLNEYQQLAMRTRCPQEPVMPRVLAYAESNVPLMHAVIGITNEAGELASALQKAFWYGKPLDKVNILEELGDLFWYAAEACDACGVSMQEVMEANIRKLKARYPNKYSDQLAAEENRDRAAERDAITLHESSVQGGTFVTEDLCDK